MYYYYKAKLIRYVLTVSLIFFSTISFGQNQTGVDSLNSVRSQLIANNQSTTEVDLQLYHLGNNPTCIIHQSDDYTFTFVPYQTPGNEQREQRMNLRLKAHYSFLNVIDFSEDFTSVRITCNEPLTPTIINELVSHFGYNGYEKH